MVESTKTSCQFHYLCVTGLEKMSNEKDVIKKLRKLLAADMTDADDLPVKGVAKKRGNVFAFLMFESHD